MSTHPQSAISKNTPLQNPVLNWTTLSPNDQISIRRDGNELASGRIDMLAWDGSMLWIIQNEGRGRTLFLHSDGATVFRHRQLSQL